MPSEQGWQQLPHDGRGSDEHVGQYNEILPEQHTDLNYGFLLQYRLDEPIPCAPGMNRLCVGDS
jgi:hypothetical protein